MAAQTAQPTVTEDDLARQGFEKLDRNLWRRKGDASDEPDSFHFMKLGAILPIEAGTPDDFKRLGVDLSKVPKERQPLAASLDKYAGKVTDINKLQGEEYHLAKRTVEEIDDRLIDRELAGEIVDKFVYSITTGGRNVVGLTYAGIRELAKRTGRIEMESCDIIGDDEHWIVKCRARDLQSGVAMFGVASQAKMMTLRDGRKIADEFALTKAVSKSQRNALRGIVPESAAIVLLRKWMEEAKTQAQKA